MKRIFRYICIALIIFIVVMTIINKNNIKKHFYKDNYREHVEKYASKYNVDKNLIFAIIKAESNFNKDAISNAKAKGLMQVMDSTAKDISKDLQIEVYEETILIPEINIEIGTKYISMMISKYKSINLALAAYNAGSGNVDKWIENGTLKDDGSNIENIPFKETNNYVRKILRDYEIYKEIYK